jgi:hypothetical protein
MTRRRECFWPLCSQVSSWSRPSIKTGLPLRRYLSAISARRAQSVTSLVSPQSQKDGMTKLVVAGPGLGGQVGCLSGWALGLDAAACTAKAPPRKRVPCFA